MRGASMLDEMLISDRNVVDLARFRQQRAAPIAPRLCCYCGADLGNGEKEEDCSGAWFSPGDTQPLPRRRFRAE
jgi:hypothetical protein